MGSRTNPARNAKTRNHETPVTSSSESEEDDRRSTITLLPDDEVEEIVDIKLDNNQLRCETKWKGYPPEQNTYQSNQYLLELAPSVALDFMMTQVISMAGDIKKYAKKINHQPSPSSASPPPRSRSTSPATPRRWPSSSTASDPSIHEIPSRHRSRAPISHSQRGNSSESHHSGSLSYTQAWAASHPYSPSNYRDLPPFSDKRSLTPRQKSPINHQPSPSSASTPPRTSSPPRSRSTPSATPRRLPSSSTSSGPSIPKTISLHSSRSTISHSQSGNSSESHHTGSFSNTQSWADSHRYSPSKYRGLTPFSDTRSLKPQKSPILHPKPPLPRILYSGSSASSASSHRSASKDSQQSRYRKRRAGKGSRKRAEDRRRAEICRRCLTIEGFHKDYECQDPTHSTDLYPNASLPRLPPHISSATIL